MKNKIIEVFLNKDKLGVFTNNKDFSEFYNELENDRIENIAQLKVIAHRNNCLYVNKIRCEDFFTLFDIITINRMGSKTI